MRNPEVIRRRWSGFGECRITVAPLEAPGPGSLADRLLAGTPRLLSCTGLVSLCFTVDPDWILHDTQPPASPIVTQFLRAHRRGLAQEWQSRQRPLSVTVPSRAPAIQEPIAVPVPRQVVADPAPAAPLPAPRSQPASQPVSQPLSQPRPQIDKGLPTWFGVVSCTPTGGFELKSEALDQSKPVASLPTEPIGKTQSGSARPTLDRLEAYRAQAQTTRSLESLFPKQAAIPTKLAPPKSKNGLAGTNRDSHFASLRDLFRRVKSA